MKALKFIRKVLLVSRRLIADSYTTDYSLKRGDIVECSTDIFCKKFILTDCNWAYGCGCVVEIDKSTHEIIIHKKYPELNSARVYPLANLKRI